VRVAIDATALGSGQGGDETYVQGLLAGLSAVREEGDSFPLYVHRRAAVPPAIVQNPAFPVYVLPHRSAALRHLWALPRALQRQPGGVDLVHSQTWSPLWAPVPRALMIHDLSFHYHPELYPRGLRLRLNLLVPRLVRHARVVMTDSEFSRRDLVSVYQVPSDRIFVVPIAVHGVHTPMSNGPNHGALLKDRGVRPPFFLYLGNLHPRKNVPRLIRAYARARRTAIELADHQLVIAGGRWWGDGSEEREMRQAPPGSVVFLGRVSDAERAWLLRTAEALAYPSIFEGFGLPPLEAMAVGTPVLAANTAALPETLGEAALFVDPLDEAALASGLLQLAVDSRLRAELRERGLQRAARYTVRAMGESALHAFRAAIGAGGQSRTSAPVVRA